ncbi:MAG: hypothetical protein JXM73_16060 [Anaerolineae bacterium]|nr:hypothetical protein [Anaerolineae bacterium]
MSRWWLVLIVVVALIVGGAAVAVAMGARALAPARVVLHFPWTMLADEAAAMNDCVECHEPEKFHNCTTCHDEHGSAEMANIPFNQLVLLAGDLPEPGYVAVNDILPYRDQPGTQAALLDLLAKWGVTGFERVALFSSDGGVVMIERPDLTRSALLMPHVDGVRFADEGLHISTWLKGIARIVVVGVDKPLSIDGQTTSMGRLLLRATRSATVEPADVMFKSEDDGQVRRAKTASRIEGAPIEDLVGLSAILVRDIQGQEHTLSADEAEGAILAQIDGRTVLVLPGRGQPQWIFDVVEITSR